MPNFSNYVSRLYHFTDHANLASIAELGGLYSWAKLQGLGIDVPIPGGNDLSHSLDAKHNLDSYVHLCFRCEHPMEYVARQQGRIPNAVFLEIHADILDWHGVLFTDAVSIKTGVAPMSRAEANDVLDFEVLYERTDWTDPIIKERLKKAKKYEVLVPDFIPVSFIANLFDFDF